MAGLLGTVLRAALTARLSSVGSATSSYVRDQIDYGKSTLNSYVVGAGFYVVAGIFLIAAVFVGASALFDWLEVKYGRFSAYGFIGAGLVVLALIAVALAAAARRRHEKRFPSLSNRLRVAMQPTPQASETRRPAPRDPVASARRTAASVLSAPSSPRSSRSIDSSPIPQRVGLAAAVGLIGWALARRLTQSAPPPAPPPPPPPPAPTRRPRRG